MHFPNLFVIGAMKAGTSSLHEYLHQHPAIFMCRFKEPQYFAPHRVRHGDWGQGNPLPEPGMDWYLRLFKDAGDVQYAGESSVSYTARHWVPGCEQRIWEFNPESRIIYLLRDPVERAISHYWHFVAEGREDRSLLHALRTRDDYIARSDYAYQIEPYLGRFGASQVYLVTVEQLAADPQATFAALFRWLGVNEQVPIDISKRLNVGDWELRKTRRFFRPAVRFFRSWSWRRFSHNLPNWARTVPERAVRGSIDRSQVDTVPAIEYLQAKLAPRIRILCEMTSRRFPEWESVGPGEYAESTDDCGASNEIKPPQYRSTIDAYVG